MALRNEYKSAELKNKIDVYTKQKVKNEVGKYEYRYEFYKSVFANLRLVRKKTRQGQADTEYDVLNHEIYLRAQSLPDVDHTYRFKYKTIHLQAKYITHDFDRTGMVYIYCEQVVE